MRLINLDDLNELIDYYISQAEENLETAHGCDDSDDAWVWQGALNTWRGFKEEVQGLSVADVAEASTRRDYKLDEWCDGCKEYDHKRHCCPRFNRVIRETVEDFNQEHHKKAKWTWVEEESGTVWKTGEPIFDAHFQCSECGFRPFENLEGDEVLTKYCPHCGAKMENADEKEEEQ